MGRLRVVLPHDSKHFRDRLFARFGILLTPSDMWDLRDQIRKAPVVKRENGIVTYLCQLQHKPMHIVYDRDKDWFITACHLNSVEQMEAARIE